MAVWSALFQVSGRHLVRVGRCLGAAWLVLLVGLVCCVSGTPIAAAEPAGGAAVRLADHVLPDVANMTPTPASASAASQPLTLTFVLKRDDEAGFQKYLHDVYDPASSIFRQFLGQSELTQKFGPSQQDYDQVLAYLRAENFTLTQGSANHLTLTARASRASVEQAFAVHIADYELAGRTFHANDTNPAVPNEIAQRVQTVVGLSNLAEPAPSVRAIRRGFCQVSTALIVYFNNPNANTDTLRAEYKRKLELCIQRNVYLVGVQQAQSNDPPPPAWQGADGTGQTVGLLEFDTFNPSDVSDYIALIGLPATKIGEISQIHVNGGAGSPGAATDEVLLDINAILNFAPGAKIAVYDGAFTGSGTSFQAMFNAMVNGPATIISNSWAYCEDQTTLADVKSIDSILQSAAASGISVFNGSGDDGSTCLDGSPNTISVPADSPNATAVGGTSLTIDPGAVYAGETWWDGTSATPPTGQGGFGVSRFFSRPNYQNGQTTSAMRSVPDVVANADPAGGLVLCNASEGGCPTGTLNGGTSLAAPEWAAYAALWNQTQGSQLGALNPLLYPLSASGAFHDPASMSSDFAHVGLGSPKLAALHQQFTHQSTGPVDPVLSQVRVYDAENFSFPPTFSLVLPAFDDNSPNYVVVRLWDSNGNIIVGKTVKLSANAGSHATITPASGVTTADNGAVVFTVTDLVTESLAFTATDTTDGITLAERPQLNVMPSVATVGNIIALSDAAAADGISTDTITVSLQDAQGRPTPGKLVTLQQVGNSVISGPTPNVTNSSGQIAFTVTDTVQETVTYTATDVTDGNLPVPGSALVAFSAGGGDNCGSSNFGNPDIAAASGYAITPYATGFLPKRIAAGGLYAQCRGADGLAFDAAGNLFVSEAAYGNIYKFPPGGGVVGAGTRLTPTALGPLLAGLTFGNDGKLYAAQIATTGNFFTGAVLEVNSTTGALVRTVASSITCASFLATDPASGDVFVDDSCGGGGSDNPSIWRIANPGSATPTTSVYATTSGTNGGLAFAPGGTLYVIDYYGTGLSKISGTAAATPGQRTQLNGVSSPALDIAALGTQANGDAQTLVIGTNAVAGGLPAGIKTFDATTLPITPKTMLVNNAYATVDLLGPDGCLYAGTVTAVYKISRADGSCPLNLNQAALTLSPVVLSPNPTQGSAQTFTATFHNTTVAAGTAVTFQIRGANAQVKLAFTNASGQATMSYAGVAAGNDTIVASAIIGSTAMSSNPAQVTWNQGPHTTSLSLNSNPGGANAGRPIALSASLVDASVQPVVAVSGATIVFTLDGQSCSAVTNASGIATCNLTLPAIGAFTLVVTYAGSPAYLPATASQVMSALDLIFADGFDQTLMLPDRIFADGFDGPS